MVNRRERCRLAAARDDRQPRPREREDERGHARAGDRDVRADPARGRLAAQLLADGARRAEQPLQPADVDRHEIVAMPLVAGRELLGDGDERGAGLSGPRSGGPERAAAWILGDRRSVETRVQGSRDQGIGIRE